MSTLELAADLHLPTEAVTQTLAILAKRGSGKTYTASVLVEELLGASAQVVIIDPLDVWWGLRVAADGEGPGLPIVVLGGSRGDLPLEAAAGVIIADMVVEEGISCILSLRHLSKTQQRRVVADFAERLYHRKGEPEHRGPLHVVIDEADAFVPQRVAADTARVMGAVDDLVRRGRASGLGVTLITQRPAVLHKDVLTQIEVLVALRTVSPQDRAAIKAWIEGNDDENQGPTVLASLASLDIGEAWIWSPGWLAFSAVSVSGDGTRSTAAPRRQSARRRWLREHSLRLTWQRCGFVSTRQPIHLKTILPPFAGASLSLSFGLQRWRSWKSPSSAMTLLPDWSAWRPSSPTSGPR